MTRILSNQGRVGFEYLTDLLNSLFRSLESVIVRYDGDILKFSGDAVWCYFPSGTDVAAVYAEMLHQINDLNNRESICRQFPLSLHAGATLGEFDLLSITAENQRTEFEIVGSTIQQAYKACDIAKAGEICVDSSIYSEAIRSFLKRSDSGFYVLAPEPRNPEERSLRKTVDPIEVDSSQITKYLPGDLLERMGNGDAGSPQREHRRVNVVFVNVQPQSEQATSERLLAHLANIMDAVHEARGIVARIDPFGSGHKVLALFGAITSTGFDAINSLRAAARIANVKSEMFINRTGIALGPLLCGEVGSQSRREFTVMGNAVNLAARLMSKAEPDGILIDADFHSEVEAHCQSRPLDLTLKGFDKPVTVYAYESLNESRYNLPTVDKFFGRETELAAIRGFILQSDRSRNWLAISGNAGIGKTSLAVKSVESITDRRVIYLNAISSQLRSGGWLIYELIREVCDASDDKELFERLQTVLDPRWQPVIYRLSGSVTSSADDPLGDLPPDIRISKIASITASVLNGILKDDIIILDNLESLEPLSRMLLQKLVSELETKTASFVLIDAEPAWQGAGENAQTLEVAGLEEAAIKSWLRSVLSDGKRETDLASQIVKSSSGSPLLITEMINLLIDSGTLAHISDPNKFDVAGTLDNISLSGRVEELQLARFDRLNESQRHLLKLASVFPTEFGGIDLAYLLEHSVDLHAALEQLVGVGLIAESTAVSADQDVHYRFANAAFRETIYNRIPVLQLQNLHAAIAARLQMESDENVFDLAYHFSRSTYVEDAFHYSLQAAIRANGSGLTLEAGRFFKSCEECLSGADLARFPSNEILQYYQLASSYYISEGNYKQAHWLVQRWRRFAAQVDNTEHCHASANELARLFWKQSRYNLCRPTLRIIEARFASQVSTHLIDTLALQGELLRRTGQVLQAQNSCRRAVTMARSLDQSEKLVNALNNLGLAYWSAGNLDGAAECYEQSLSLQQSGNARYLEARVANNLGIISEEKGDFIRARELVDRARSIFAEFGDRRNQSYASGNLANLQVHAGRYREATDLFITADRIFQHLGETHPHYYTVGNLADIDLILGQIDKAVAGFRSVLEFARGCSDKELEAETRVRLAECAFYGGTDDDIAKQYEEAIALARDAESMEYQVRGSVGLCRFLIGTRDVEAVQKRLSILDEFVGQGSSARNHHEAIFLHGELDRICGRITEAVEKYRLTADYARSQEQFELLLKSLSRLTELDSSHGDDSCLELGHLLKNFDTWNGAECLQQLLNSSYYRYFCTAMIRSLEVSGMARHHQALV